MRRTAWIGSLCAAALLAGCTGYTAYEQGRRLTMEGEVEKGVKKMEQAVKQAPNNANYRRTLERDRELLVTRYLAEGDIERAAGRLDGAEAAYRRALDVRPNDSRVLSALAAIEELRQLDATVKQAGADIEAGALDQAERRLREVLAKDDRRNDGKELLNRIEEKRAEARMAGEPSTLKGPFTKPITLEFRDAPLRSVFEVMSRASGINFVFDKDVRGDQKITIFVRNTSLDDVVKLILATNQLDRKLLNETSVLIYPNTPAKQKEYRELVVRSFYLVNADVKQALNMVKGMVKTQDVFIDEKLNLMVVKDTPEAVRLVHNLVRSLDLAEPEVMLEVSVLELASSRIQQLGVRYPAQINIGVPPTGTGAAAAASVFRLGTDTLKGWVVNPPVVVDLTATDADGKVLANPRIRVKNREKAKVHIGSRVPVVTTTSTANVGVSSSVSYLDVGLKLDVEPNIYLRDQVAIKVGLEVSNIIREVNINNTLAYEIGTRNTGTVLQLRDGETQILAGLINDEDRRTANKIPGFGDIPVLGRLFGTQRDTRTKTEIVLLITPRIVRAISTTGQVTTTDLPVGTDAAIGAPPLRLSSAAPGSVSLPPGGGGGARPLVPLPEAPSPLPVPPAGQEGAGAAQATLLLAGPIAARANSEIIVSLTLPPTGSITRATAELAYDAAQFEPVGATASQPGRLPLRVDGSASVRMRVLGTAGRGQVRVENAVGLDPNGAPAPVVAPAPLEITITP
jgi:general secretion pathway protein D